MHVRDLDHVGNDPSVNSVCFSFPFFFFPLRASDSSAIGRGASASDGAPEGVFSPAFHAVGGATLFPRIFCKLRFPLTSGFCRVPEEEGRVGNAVLESGGGVDSVFLPLL